MIYNKAIGLKNIFVERCKYIDIYYTKIEEDELEQIINEGITKYVSQISSGK